VVIFGAMGFMRIKVDIGSMMTASVAMGIAVDDTIHFLNWFRKSLDEGRTRIDSIRIAFGRCAPAMTQTTLIAGLGLSVFALSTFAPTQRFGVLMLLLLAAALVGDLILLPAILASPLGRFFGSPAERNTDKSHGTDVDEDRPHVLPINEHHQRRNVDNDDVESAAKRRNSQ
jgi:predicted RND superfamily exporter protein